MLGRRCSIYLIGRALSTLLLVGNGGCIAGESGEVVGTFLESHCLECHDAETSKGDVSMEGIVLKIDSAEAAGIWNRVLEQMVFRQMPPQKKPRPDEQTLEQFVRTIEKKLIESGHRIEVREKLKSPEYGNYIDHERLFDGSVEAVPWSPSRLWKRSSHVFDSMLVRGIGLGQGRYGRPNGHLNKVKQPFTLEGRAGIRDYAAITQADSATLGTLLRNAEVIVDTAPWRSHVGSARESAWAHSGGSIAQRSQRKAHASEASEDAR